MTAKNLFTQETIQKTRTAMGTKFLQDVNLGNTNKQNELVFFIKPELLDVEQDQQILGSMQLIKTKFEEFDIQVDGAAIIPGTVLDQFGIMNQHYGFINTLSRKASKMLDTETRQALFSALGIHDKNRHQILGGHEFLKKYKTDVDTLSDLWFAQESKKLRSGFYFIASSYEDECIILVNGFHPAQLHHFTNPDHRIFLMLMHTDTDWYDMKFDLVGDTFPERAKPDSIRGRLYANPDRYGQREVTINTNGVHLSAGPFESAFEAVNFFGPLIDLDPAETPPLALQEAITAGYPKEKVLALLKNPEINDSDLFSETENLNTPEAVRLLMDKFAADRHHHISTI